LEDKKEKQQTKEPKRVSPLMWRRNGDGNRLLHPRGIVQGDYNFSLTSVVDKTPWCMGWIVSYCPKKLNHTIWRLNTIMEL